MFSEQSTKRNGMFFRFVVLAFCLAGTTAAAELADPTRPPQAMQQIAPTTSSAGDEWQLGAIVIAAERRVAMINGRPMTVGDEIAGARVVAIEPGQVHLRRRDRQVVLKLLPAGPISRALSAQD